MTEPTQPFALYVCGFRHKVKFVRHKMKLRGRSFIFQSLS